MKFADSDGYLDIIIYVILMVVGLAASAYKNFTKRKQEQQRKEQGELYPDFPELDTEPVYDEEVYQEEPEYQEDPFIRPETNTQEIIEPDPPVIPEPIVQTINKESKLDRPFSEVEVKESLIDRVVENEMAFLPKDSDQFPEDVIDDISSGDLARNEIGDSSDEEDLMGTFDAKKAVVYAEIINPKYIQNIY